MNLDRFCFKAKNILGEWVYAEPYEDEGGAGLGLAWKRPEGRFQFHPVIKKTLCQSTGIRDSDGRLIYENDYVTLGKNKNNGKDIVYLVTNYNEISTFELIDEKGVAVPLVTLEYLVKHDKDGFVKVIGNKYDKEIKNDN